MHLCPKNVFKFIKQIFNELLLGLLEKTKYLYVLLAFIECHIATTSFDLWMLVGHDIFW